jgi:hypothetical protein
MIRRASPKETAMRKLKLKLKLRATHRRTGMLHPKGLDWEWAREALL